MKNWIFFFLLTLPLAGWAHRPNETNYTLVQEDQEWIMTVHCTPLSAIRILESVGAISENEPQVKLLDHEETITQYFNDHVKLELNRSPVQFVWQSGQFGGHDALIHFQVINGPESLKQFSCTIDAFHDIFRRPQNVLRIREGQESSVCMLDINTTSCHSKSVWTQGEKIQILSWWIGLFIPLILIGIVVLRIVLKPGAPASSVISFG